MYELVYLPIARQDIIDIVRYIHDKLCNPIAAGKLADLIVKTADKLRAFPYVNAVYTPVKPLKHEYRKAIVQNYLMFYWVDEKTKTVTIARVIYARSDYGQKL